MKYSIFTTYLLLLEFLQVRQTGLKSLSGRIWLPGRSLPYLIYCTGTIPSETWSYLQSGSGRQVGGNAVLSSASVAGFGVEEAVQQPRRVKHVHHKDTEQQLGDGAPFGAAVGGLRATRCQHGGCLKQVIDGTTSERSRGSLEGPECVGPISTQDPQRPQHPSGCLSASRG